MRGIGVEVGNDMENAKAPIESLLLFATLMSAVLTAMPRTPQEAARPTLVASAINSTYVVYERRPGGKTIEIKTHLYEENGKLMMEQTWGDGDKGTKAIELSHVSFVGYSVEKLPHGNGDMQVEIWNALNNWMSVPVDTEEEGTSLAEAVAKKSPAHLELIGGAWRIRKPFKCPESVAIACADFKELLDHEDADILDSFYSRPYSTYSASACFSSSMRRFFTVQHPMYHQFAGTFSQNIFIDGQSKAAHFAQVDWSPSDYATMYPYPLSAKLGAKQVGYITPSELTYQTAYTNKNNTETQYSLTISWFRGSYIERFSWKDENGKPLSTEDSGICVELNYVRDRNSRL